MEIEITEWPLSNSLLKAWLTAVCSSAVSLKFISSSNLF